MKKRIGITLKQMRTDKGFNQKDVCGSQYSLPSLADIESGKKEASAERLIQMLNYLNINYNEFVHQLDNEYIQAKAQVAKHIREQARLQNIDRLKQLVLETRKHYETYQDIYFQHMELLSLATIHLIKSDNDFHGAREYLHPIRKYLSSAENFYFYELSLISHCLFMFEIDDAIFFGKQALRSLEKDYDLYQGTDLSSTLLNNLAAYSLNYHSHLPYALKYAKKSEQISHESYDLAKALYAKIIQQIAYFKLKSKKFDKEYMTNLVRSLQLLDWKREHERLVHFVQKHGIMLD